MIKGFNDKDVMSHFVVAFYVSLFIGYINFNAFLKGGEPSFFQFLASVLLILFWFIYGIKMGKKKRYDFIIFLLLFWVVGAFIILLDTIGDLRLSIIPAFILVGPLYGLRYLLKISPEITLALISIIIAFIVSLLGFFIGKMLKTKL